MLINDKQKKFFIGLITILILAGIGLKGPYLYQLYKTYQIKNPSSAETCKKYKGNEDFSCMLNLAVKNKNFLFCESLVYEDRDKSSSNLCMQAYSDIYPDIETCRKITDDGSQVKNVCFENFAARFQDLNACDGITDLNEKDYCVKLVNDNIYQKNELCPPLYKNDENGNPPLVFYGECQGYVFRLRDPKMCLKLQTKREQDTCIADAK
jgi:hypothetical protein